MKNLVSIIITTKNEQGVIARLLESIKHQTYKKVETIIIDNHSSDKTKSIAKKFTKKVFTAGPERSAQRNFGAKKAKGEYFLFLDADMELSSKVVEKCVQAIHITKKGLMVVIPEQSIATRYWERVKAYERSFCNESGDNDIEAARFFRATDFKNIGGYDQKITGPEDWDLPERRKKLGIKTTRIKEVIYHHERIKSVWELARKKYYYGLKANTYMKSNNVSVISPKTIYLLRPIFYKQWRKLLSHPLMSLSMFLMLSVEQFMGGWGYLRGRHKSI